MKINNEKGQSLIEMIIFLPLLFTVYALVSGFANAIYGSINQQKATRAYFYYRVQNNSTIPRRPENVNWTKFGHFFVGWREKSVDDSPYAPCYRISIPIASPDDTSCDESYTSQASSPSTQYIRVGTVYGACGATYYRNNDLLERAPNRIDLTWKDVLDRESCLIK